MVKNLPEINLEVLQQRLQEEIEAQGRLQEELRVSLQHERDLRLENELLWVYLQKKHPSRVDDASDLLERLTAGGDLGSEMQERSGTRERRSRTVVQRTRNALGKFPGVRQVYHGLKSFGK